MNHKEYQKITIDGIQEYVDYLNSINTDPTCLPAVMHYIFKVDLINKTLMNKIKKECPETWELCNKVANKALNEGKFVFTVGVENE